MWLKDQVEVVLPKRPIGDRTSVLVTAWTALPRYLEDGALAIDNSAAQHARDGGWSWTGRTGSSVPWEQHARRDPLPRRHDVQGARDRSTGRPNECRKPDDDATHLNAESRRQGPAFALAEEALCYRTPEPE